MRLSSPTATKSRRRSGLSAMPRGRRPTGMVAATASVAPSMTEMVLSCSFET
jgi:hypothetical protein